MNNAFSNPFETWIKDQFGIVRNTDGTKLEDLFELKDCIIPEKPEEELYGCLNGEPSVSFAYMGEALLKRREDTISENIKLFFDAQHMNKIGSKCMTSIIENNLRNGDFYK